jgi:hypothetical protein
MQNDIRLQFLKLQPISFLFVSGVMMMISVILPYMAAQATSAVAKAGL